jgi:HSP20 family protein
MSLATRSMLRELDTLRERLDRFFSDSDIEVTSSSESMIAPALDVQETDEELIIKASMAGMKADDIEVHIDDSILTIRGSSHEEREEKEGTWHVRERRSGSVFRSLALPTVVDNEKADARMSDGVLEVRLPKTDTERGRKIEVKSN